MNEFKAKEHILLVDSDINYCTELISYLEMHSYIVTYVKNKAEAIALLAERKFDLILSEALFENENALEFCKKIYESEDISFIFLSKLGEISDRVLGLEFGADDYLDKNCDKRELIARIKAVMRRTKKQRKFKNQLSEHYIFEDWALSTQARHLIDANKEIVNLSGAEYKLLFTFLKKPHKVISREELIEILQGYTDEFGRNPFDRSIDVQVSRLRAKLKEKQRITKLIKTVRGDGYVFTAQVKREFI